jgi:murein DD-endopeptidase MepM/ murein hydrolase activator NlpD
LARSENNFLERPMAQRFYTFIVVPNASSRLHKVRVPIYVIYAFAALGFVAFMAFAGLGFSYARMAFKVGDYNLLQAENTDLKVEKKNLEVTAKKLSGKIEALETLSAKLTSLIENDTFMQKYVKGGVGGTTKDYRTSDIVKDGLSSNIEALKDRAAELENRMAMLEKLAERRAKTIRSTPTIWPIRGRIASHYGGRLDPFTGDREVHLGLDITGMYGTPVHSPADGLVIFAGRKSDYGNLVIIDHGNGVTTRLGHLSRFSVRVGTTVTKGQVIAYVGMTGRTTGPHLHYEVRVNDRPVNPRGYMPPEG